MRKTKKLLSIISTFVVAFALFFSLFSGINKGSVFATDPRTDIVYAAGETTNVHIKKFAAKRMNVTQGVVAKEGAGAKINDVDALKTQLGVDGDLEGLKDVVFTYFIVSEQQLSDMMANPSNFATVQQVQAKVGAANNGTALNPTDAQGDVTVSLPDGYYWFIETQKPVTVSTAVAVPFGLSLPATNPENVGANGEAKANTKAGTLVMTDLYIYPKNVSTELPKIDKTVGTSEDGKTASYNIGDEVPWKLKSTIPTNIKDYTKFEFEDKLDTKLTYVPNSVTVKYNNQAVPTYKYTVNFTAGTNTLKVSMNTEQVGGKTVLSYFKDMQNTNIPGNYKLVVEFKTKINENAILGKDIQNPLKVTFNNTPGNPTDRTEELPEPQNPSVVTGGRKFVKVDKAQQTTTLEGAMFQLYNGTQPLTWTKELAKANETAILAGKFAKNINGEKTVALTDAVAGQPIYLLSSADGSFEIRGLAYSSWQPKKWDETSKALINDGGVQTNDWKLKELIAPSGYSLPRTEIAFTIDETSYNTNPQTTNDGDAEASKIDNVKLTIPKTGGMGTILFIVIGVAIMVIAVIAIKKRKTTQE